jgi:hemerythrin
MIKWKDDYLLGVEVIDQQHKELFRIAGDAYDLLNNEFFSDKYDKVVRLIEELKNYALFHFETEEKYLLEIGYKKYFSHKIIHDDFVNKFKSIDLEKLDENQDDYLSSIIMFIVDWIEHHILGTDKQYVD